MRYTIIKLFSFLVFLLQLSTVSAQYIPCERSYTVFYNPFLQKVNDLKDVIDKLRHRGI